MLQEQYNTLLKYATKKVLECRSSLSPEELVSEAYLQYHNKPFDEVVYKKAMLAHLRTEGRLIRKFSITNEIISYKGEDTKVCTCCHDLLPIGAFTLINSPDSIDYFSSYCKPCIATKMRELYKKRNPNKKVAQNINLLWRKANQKYQSKPEVKERHNEKMREYSQFQKDNLTDIYIKTLIRCSSEWKESRFEITQDIIEYKRSLVRKRLLQVA